MKNILTAIILVFGLSACNWRPPSPNEPFYCKVNGKNFRPEKDTSPIGGIGADPLSVTYNPSTGGLAIYARSESKFVGVRIIFPDKVVKVGRYNLTLDKTTSVGLFSKNNNDSNPTDLISETGEVNITKLDNKIISGEFNFVCKNSKEYKITKGCFNKLTYF
jgi:Family of unknown function (DUF6252)